MKKGNSGNEIPVPVSWTPDQLEYTVHIGGSFEVPGTILYEDGHETRYRGLLTSKDSKIVKANNDFEATAVGNGTVIVEAAVSFPWSNTFTERYVHEITVNVVE